ncbi:TolC family protein [Variovorax sp. VNK109]|uniref:TolC family protein n=1 Tax=Variovorax sp. VNK109 TaxID=3400919 RepID=UPI003C0A4D33
MLGLAFIAAGTVHAQTTLSLSQALQAARTHDPRYQIALREFEGSREYRIAGKAATSAEATASASAYRNLLEQRVGAVSRDSAYTSSSLALQVRQPLYAPELQARVAIGEARSLQGEAQLAVRDAELSLRVIDAYLQSAVLRGQLVSVDALIQALEQQSRGAERMIQLGEGTRTDSLEARSRLQLARAQRIEAEESLRDARRRLATMVGGAPAQPGRQEPADAASLSPGFEPLRLEPEPLSAWEALALENNPQIRVARHAASVARAEAQRNDAQKKVRVDAIGSLSRNDSDSVNTLNQTNTQASIGVQLTVPIFNGGRLDSAARLAVAQASQAEAELLDAQESALADVRLFHSQVASTAGRIQALGLAREAAALQVDATRQSVKGGIRVMLDVLNAESQRYEVERDLVRVRAEHLRAWVKLRSTAGVLADADVARLDKAFEDAKK